MCKRWILARRCAVGVLAAAFLTARGDAQTLAPPEQLAAIRKLDFLVGTWEGDGWMDLTAAKPCKLHASQVVQSKLGGLLLVIDGTFHSQFAGQGPETIVHGVYGLIFYDLESNQYRFVGFTSHGFPINATAEVGNRHITWSTAVPHLGDIVYSIRVDEEDHWIQTGEIIEHGQQRPLLEVNLQRVHSTEPQQTPPSAPTTRAATLP